MKRFCYLIISFCIALFAIADTVIQMESYAGVYRVPCLVNGARMKFIFDTGASNVCLSQSMAEYLYDNGYITDQDLIGIGSATVADGRIVDHIRLNLKEIQIGDRILSNVEAVVVNGQSAPLLLGQSALKKLGSYSISGNKLIFKSTKSSSNDDEVLTELSEEEIDQLFKEADQGYADGLYHVALEKYEILYNNDILNAVGILDYADCLYFCDNSDTALNLCLEIQNEIEAEYPHYKAYLYYRIGRCYYKLSNFDATILYMEKVMQSAEQWSYTQKDAIDLMAEVYYRFKSNPRKACNIVNNYLDKFLKSKNINEDDCWNKNSKDEFLADIFYLKYLYDQPFGPNPIINEKYLIIAAAWGSKDAIESCSDRGIDFSKRPR